MPGELAPSVIAADFSRLAHALKQVEPYAARWHVDVMDGHYVPNLTVGPMIVEAIADISSLPQDVHLMVSNPNETWEWYAQAGAARIAFHPAQSSDPSDLLRRIKTAGCGAGLAINPDVEFCTEFMEADHLIVMTVHPGFSGQKFIDSVMPKLSSLRGIGPQLIVDGGVNLETAPSAVSNGADVLVSASAIFGAPNPEEVARRLAASWKEH